MHAALAAAERLDRALAVLARPGMRTRLHHAVSTAAGTTIDRAAYLVLRWLHLEGPARITDVALQMGVEPSTASRHVHLLDKRGWIAKERDAADRRVATAVVTPKGAAVVERMEQERRRILATALDDWSHQDLNRFIDSLEHLAVDLSDALDGIE